jgi:hypothetical protein
VTVGPGSDPTHQWQAPQPPPPQPPYGPPALIATAGGVLMVLVLAAVAIPVFLDQRAKADLSATSVTLPPTVAGLPEVDDPAVRQQLAEQRSNLSTCGCTEPLLLTLYQDQAGTHRIVVMAGKFTHPAGPTTQQSIVDDTWRGIRDGAAGTLTFGTPVDADPGALGGRVTCAPITTGTTGRACVAVDGTSIVTMMEFAPPDTDLALPTVVRESVVHRT